MPYRSTSGEDLHIAFIDYVKENRIAAASVVSAIINMMLIFI